MFWCLLKANWSFILLKSVLHQPRLELMSLINKLLLWLFLIKWHRWKFRFLITREGIFIINNGIREMHCLFYFRYCYIIIYYHRTCWVLLSSNDDLRSIRKLHKCNNLMYPHHGPFPSNLVSHLSHNLINSFDDLICLRAVTIWILHLVLYFKHQFI